MNPWLLGAVAGSRRREMRHEAAQSRTCAPGPGSRPADGERRRWSRARRRIGYALVEAGLHLLATAGPAPHN